MALIKINKKKMHSTKSAFMRTFWLHKVNQHLFVPLVLNGLDSQLASYWKSKTDREGHRAMHCLMLNNEKKNGGRIFLIIFVHSLASRSFLRWRLTQSTCPLHINTKSSQQQVAVSHPVKAIAETQNASLTTYLSQSLPNTSPKW